MKDEVLKTKKNKIKELDKLIEHAKKDITYYINSDMPKTMSEELVADSTRRLTDYQTEKLIVQKEINDIIYA